MKRTFLLLLVALGLASYFGFIPTKALFARLENAASTALPAAVTEPEPLYRWVDTKGAVHYANTPPAGIKAERIEKNNPISVVPATKIPEPPKATAPLPEGKTLQQLATERAIEQATR